MSINNADDVFASAPPYARVVFVSIEFHVMSSKHYITILKMLSLCGIIGAYPQVRSYGHICFPSVNVIDDVVTLVPPYVGACLCV